MVERGGGATYIATGDEAEEEAANDGAQELGDPVEDALEQGDMAAHEEPEGDRRVHMAAGDVGGDGHGHEQSKSMGEGHAHKPSRRQGSSARQCSYNIITVICTRFRYTKNQKQKGKMDVFRVLF